MPVWRRGPGVVASGAVWRPERVPVWHRGETVPVWRRGLASWSRKGACLASWPVWRRGRRGRGLLSGVVVLASWSGDHLSEIGCSLLLVSGNDDQHTTTTETPRMYSAAREPKQLWLVDGAAHVDFHGFVPDQYEQRVLTFLRRNMRKSAAR